MTGDRRTYWRSVLQVNHACSRDVRSNLRDRHEQSEWLASRSRWNDCWPWHDGEFPQ